MDNNGTQGWWKQRKVGGGAACMFVIPMIKKLMLLTALDYTLEYFDHLLVSIF